MTPEEMAKRIDALEQLTTDQAISIAGLAKAVEHLQEIVLQNHICTVCGGQADHVWAASWYCHTHLAKWID